MTDQDPETPLKAEPDSPESEEAQEVEIDTQPIVEEVTEEVTKAIEGKLPDAEKIATSVKEKIITTLTGEEEAISPPWVKENRSPKSYEEVAEWGKERAKEELRSELADKEKEQAAKTKAAAEQEEKTQAQANEYWDKQLKQLVEEKKIPAPAEAIQAKLEANQPLTAEEKEDPGIKARAEIFQLARENQETNLELVYYKFLAKDNPPAGATAPVFGSHKAVTPSGQKDEFTWEEIHNARSLQDLIPQE